MNKLITILVSILLFGCASPDFNYRPDTTEISEPPLNLVSTAYVGEVLLRQGKYRDHDALYVVEKIDVGWAYDLFPGYYLKQGDDEKTETYLPGKDEEAGYVQKAALADPWRAILAYKEENKVCVVTNFNTASCVITSSYERRKKAVLTSDSFQQTLIYSGKIGNKVNISYREFSNNLARPAFNNNVEYDLSQSSIIGYKGAKIEILEATNEFIKYRILSNFNNAKF